MVTATKKEKELVMDKLCEIHSSESEQGTRVKENTCKKAVGITLPQNLVERARVEEEF